MPVDVNTIPMGDMSSLTATNTQSITSIIHTSTIELLVESTASVEILNRKVLAHSMKLFFIQYFKLTIEHCKNKATQFDQIMNQSTNKKYTGKKLGSLLIASAAALSPQTSQKLQNNDWSCIFYFHDQYRN